MPGFDKNAAYIWALVILGVGLPVMLAIYARLREQFAKRRLERLRDD